ncbi:MAG: hypothetical protein NTY37_08785 [Methanothrix sp.]|nr:hypothetical protein [Methanothrix sp.]
MKYGVDGKDTIVLVRPEVEPDTRGELTMQAIRGLSRQAARLGELGALDAVPRGKTK